MHIVPIELSMTDYVGEIYDGPPDVKWYQKVGCYKPGYEINKYMNDVFASILDSGKVPKEQVENNKNLFNTHAYSNKTTVRYKIYFKASVCGDNNLKDIFQSIKTIRNIESKFKRSSAQIDFATLQDKLYLNKNSIYSIVVKTMYMLTYGKNAKIKYKSKTEGVGSENYKKLLGRSVRFLWGEYEPTQWHRGVDFFVGENKPIHAICNGANTPDAGLRGTDITI